LGLPSAFRFIARAFGERLPDPAAGAMDAQAIGQTCARARYHELVNIISLVVQIPLVPMAWHVRHVPLTTYAAVLLVPHVLSIMLERYKRVVCSTIPVGDSGSGRAEAPAVAPEYRPGGFFGPHAWETERFYAIIGVGAFRRFVLGLIRVSGVEAGRDGSVRNVVGGRAGLAAFEAQTRTAELTHLLGTTLHVPFAIVFVRERYAAGLLYTFFLFGLNFACALLQRLHRVRLGRLLARYAGTKGTSDRHGPEP
jgi:hypothetical protein